MYDMYPWDKSAEAPAQSAPAHLDSAHPAVAEPATLAVQASLDLRDNGGSEPDRAPAPARQ